MRVGGGGGRTHGRRVRRDHADKSMGPTEKGQKTEGTKISADARMVRLLQCGAIVRKLERAVIERALNTQYGGENDQRANWASSEFAP